MIAPVESATFDRAALATAGDELTPRCNVNNCPGLRHGEIAAEKKREFVAKNRFGRRRF